MAGIPNNVIKHQHIVVMILVDFLIAEGRVFRASSVWLLLDREYGRK